MYGAGELVFVRIWQLCPVKKEPDVRRTSVGAAMSNQRSGAKNLIMVNMKQATEMAHSIDFEYDWVE
jgi:hypothetical protein